MSPENTTERRYPDGGAVMFLVYDSSSDKFIVEKRMRDNSFYKGFFMVPAGHVEDGEKPENTLIRELKEELCIVPLEYHHLDTFESASLHGNLLLVDAYLVKSYEGTIENEEKDKCELYFMDLDEADQKLVLAQDRYVLSLARRLLRQNGQGI